MQSKPNESEFDPLIDNLFRAPASPTPEPRKPAGGGLQTDHLITIGFLCLIAWVGYQFWDLSQQRDRRDDQHQEQNDDKKEDKKQEDKKQDEKKDSAALVLKDHMLVVVRDKKTLNDDVEFTLTMQDDEFWGWASKELADLEILEDDDELAAKLLAKTSEKPPAVILINVKSKEVVWAMPLPRGGTGSIRSRLN